MKNKDYEKIRQEIAKKYNKTINDLNYQLDAANDIIKSQNNNIENLERLVKKLSLENEQLRKIADISNEDLDALVRASNTKLKMGSLLKTFKEIPL